MKLNFSVLVIALFITLTICPQSRAELAGPIDDRRILSLLTQAADDLTQEGKLTPMKNLIAQLNRSRCSVKLPALAPRPQTSAQLAAGARPGVLVLGGVYKCTKCPHWHVNPASGFVLTESGAVATCYHVVTNRENASIVAMTDDGKVHAVREVLAADESADVAILQLDGHGFKPLPLSTNAPTGSAVRVLSHPSRHFYTLTEGIVSRQFLQTKRGRPITQLAITADFARGSSGAPVFNEQGAVVGIVDATQSLYYTVHDGQKEDLQMVFKHCIATRHLLDLIQR